MSLFDVIPWYYRLLAIILLIGAVATFSFLKGIAYCEHEAEQNELDQWRHNDGILAKNHETQADLQGQLDVALARLRRAQHACLVTPHSADIECVLNFRSGTKACP